MPDLSPYALVLDGAEIRRAQFTSTPTLAPNKGAWLAVTTTDADLVAGDGQVRVLTTTVESDHVADVWTVQDLPLADLKEAKRATATAQADQVFAGGFTATSGPLNGVTLALRNAEDRTNWLTLQGICMAQISAGNGAVVAAPFRSLANENYTLSFDDALAVLLALAAWGAGVYARLWALKDAIDAAGDKTALDAIDVTTGWP